MPVTSVPGRQIRDETVGTADLTDQAVTFTKLAAHPAGGLVNVASDQVGVKIASGSPLLVDANGLDITPVTARNIIANGNFNIWQRGTSFANAVDGQFTADRWKMRVRNTSARFNITSIGATNAISTAANGLRHKVNIADGTVNNTDLVATVYTVEGYDMLPLRLQPMTLSFWIWSSITGTMHVSFHGAGHDISYVSPVTINEAETWEYKTITLEHNLNGTWNFTNSVGMEVAFCWMAGLEFSAGTSTDTWIQAELYTNVSTQTNFMASTDNTMYLAQVQLEHGPIATPYQHVPFALDLKRCQRYFESSFALNTAPAQAAGLGTSALGYAAQNAGTSRYLLTVNFAERKRATPTMTFYNPVNSNANFYNQDRAADSAAAFLVTAGQTFFVVNNPQVGADAVTNRMYVNWSADAEL